MSRTALRRIGRTGLAAAVSLAAAVTLAGPTSAASTAAGVQQPVFVDGMAQPVFSTDPATWVRQELWVTAPVDSDRDGRPDRVHFEVTRPKETDQGLRVPVVYEASPYYGDVNDVANHDVDHELYAPSRPGQPWPGADRWGRQPATRDVGPRKISTAYESTWVPRGFAVVHAESLGTGESTGCPSSGGRNETLGAKAVVDWLNGRATAVDAQGNKVRADWTTGKTGMLGTSYNGTLPNAVASTGVEGLEATIPISAISSWYDYYRADGAVVAPGGYQGEDTEVLAKFVYSRADRDICTPVIDALERDQDRVTGDYSPFWAERDYLRDAGKVRAATLVAHGLQDWNVKTRHAAQWYEELKRNHVPHKIYWHQGGHGGPPPADVQNRWFTRYLYDVDNGVEDEPKALIQREDKALVSYPEWPDPGSRTVAMSLRPRGDRPTGDLVPDRATEPAAESFTDIPTQTIAELAAAPDSEHGRVYTTPALAAPVRISGVPEASLRLTLAQRAANVSVGLVDLAPDGTVTRLVTQGWRDPQNRRSVSRTEVVRPGTPYTLGVTLQANDYVFAAGHRIALVLMSTDEDYTIRPTAGARLTVDTAATTLQLPVVGGVAALRAATG